MEKPTNQKDPKMDWGFYAMTPRIVRTKYKELSHTEKWLYTCLRDLCGRKGTCFRTLRSLKEETDISIASLSAMIPRLHAAGLIHAEKKRRSASGKEIWHISIVDIWQMNKDYCSENEQSNGEDVQNLNNDPEIVHSVNNDVQNLNKTPEDCSENERDCSNFRNRRRYPKNKDTEIYNEEEGTYSGQHREQSQPCADAQPAPASSQDDLLKQIRSRIPEGDAVLLERLSNGNHRIYRKSGRSIGELIPVGVDVSDGLLELITVDAVEPCRPDYNASQRRGPLTQFFEDAIAGAQRAGASPIANDTEDTSHGFSGNSSNHLRGDRDSDSVDAGEHPQPAAGHTSRDVRLPAAGTGQTASAGRTERSTGDTRAGSTGNGVAPESAGGNGYQKPQQQTLAGTQYQPPVRTQRGSQSRQNEKLQMTLMGGQVRDWYDIIRACKLRLTQTNIKALNVLGDLEEMSFVNLKDTIELIEAQNLVKSKNIPIDPQALASEDGYWRFDKWFPVVVRNRNRQQQRDQQTATPKSPIAPSSVSPATTTNYGLAALVADNPLVATGGMSL